MVGGDDPKRSDEEATDRQSALLTPTPDPRKAQDGWYLLKEKQTKGPVDQFALERLIREGRRQCADVGLAQRIRKLADR